MNLKKYNIVHLAYNKEAEGLEIIANELYRTNLLMALLIQLVMETHGNPIKFKEQLDKYMEDIN